MPFSADTRLSSASLGKFGIFDGDASSLDKASPLAKSAMLKLVRSPVADKILAPIDKLKSFRNSDLTQQASMVAHKLIDKIDEIAANKKLDLSPLADSPVSDHDTADYNSPAPG